MFIKGNTVYADAYHYLKHKTKNIIALSFKGNADDFFEYKMDLPIQIEINNNTIFWQDRKLAIMPKSLSYKDVKERIIKSRYTYDEQIAIILNNDLGEDSEYIKMQEWREFASHIARLVENINIE